MVDVSDEGLDIRPLMDVGQFDEGPSDGAAEGKRPRALAGALGVKRFKHEDADLQEVERALAALAPKVERREIAEARAFSRDEYPEWRLEPPVVINGKRQPRVLRNPDRTGLAKLLSSNDQEMEAQGAAFISYERMHMAANEMVDFTLNGQLFATTAYSHDRAFLVQSNRETTTLDFARRNAKELLSMVPADGGTYRLTPMQRIATALMLENTDREVYINMKAHPSRGAAALRQDVSFWQTPSDSLTVQINNLPVAAGKTWETIFATMSRIATPEAWEVMKARFDWFKGAGTAVPHLGITRMPLSNKALSLARVVIALVPAPVMQQWHETSTKLAATYGEHAWITWLGTQPLVRKSRGVAEVKRVMSQAVKLTRERNCALFWVMESCTRSMTVATREAPHFGIAFRVIDEGTGAQRTEPTNKDPESPILKTIICNATFEQLEKHTQNQPNHPLRRALGGYNMHLAWIEHSAIMSMCTVPSWLREAVGRSLEPMMPRGILKISMLVRVTSLGGRLNKTDMVVASPDQLIDAMILNTCRNMMTEVQRDSLGRLCRMILYRTDNADSIAQSLQNSIESARCDLVAVGPNRTVPDGQRLSEADRLFNQGLDARRRALNTMQRVFARLKEAICVDPPPECPVTMEPIAPENVCLLRCCGVFIDRTILHKLSNKCPACREPIDGVVSAAEAAETVANATGKRAALKEAEEAAAGGGSGSADGLDERIDPNDVGDVEALAQAFKRCKGEQCGSSLDAVIKSIRIALRYKPRGLRILLCCNVFGNQATNDQVRDEMVNTKKMRGIIAKAVPELSSVATVGKGGKLEAFQAEDQFNRLLVLDTSGGSITMAGINLQNTDLILFDRLDNEGGMSTDKMVQSIGRAMRAQRGTPEQTEANLRYFRKYGRSAHPPKLVVFIDRHRPAQRSFTPDGRGGLGSGRGARYQ